MGVIDDLFIIVNFVKTFLDRITYPVVKCTLFYDMVLLQLLKHKPQHGMTYIKQNMYNKNTGMRHPYSLWKGQYDKGT